MRYKIKVLRNSILYAMLTVHWRFYILISNSVVMYKTSHINRTVSLLTVIFLFFNYTDKISMAHVQGVVDLTFQNIAEEADLTAALISAMTIIRQHKIRSPLSSPKRSGNGTPSKRPETNK